mgnify:CR=1 FL=1
MFNLLITLMTLIAVAFICVWWWRPDFRRWTEAPKYHLLEQERRVDAAARAARVTTQQATEQERPD